MKKTICAALLACSFSANAAPNNKIQAFSLNTLHNIFFNCSQNNRDLELRKITANSFLARAEKAAFAAKKMASEERKEKDFGRARMLKKQAELVEAKCKVLRINRKLANGRYTNDQVNSLFKDHNDLVELMKPDFWRSATHQLKTFTNKTILLASKHKKEIMFASALAAIAVIAYLAGHNHLLTSTKT